MERSINYDLSEQGRMLLLKLDQLMSGFPLPGQAAILDPLHFCDEAAAHVLLHPECYLLPEGEFPSSVPPARVHVDSLADYYEVVEYLLFLGVVREIKWEDIYRIGGKPLLLGAFAVKNSGGAPPGVAFLTRFIFNMIPPNSYRKELLGDGRFNAIIVHFMGVNRFGRIAGADLEFG